MIYIAAIIVGASALGLPFFVASWVESPKAEWALARSPSMYKHGKLEAAKAAAAAAAARPRNTAGVSDSCDDIDELRHIRSLT